MYERQDHVGFLNRLRKPVAMPNRPLPNSNTVAGSGIADPVIRPCTVVIPLFEAGGTRFSGLFVIE